jgi:[ribosomal protein S5]-alanine N-acetyltransferase
MKPIPTLEAGSVILRPFVAADAPEVQRLAGDRAIADTTLNMPHPYEDGMAEAWISTHAAIHEDGQGVTFAITRKVDGVLVGAISLMNMTTGHQAELGYWIGKQHWNQGYCTDAVRSVLRYAFEELGLIRVHACYFSRNAASGRVMQKLGMRHEGCRRQHILKWNRLEDLELYGILKREWEVITALRGTPQ